MSVDWHADPRPAEPEIEAAAQKLDELHISGWDTIADRLDSETLKRLGGYMTIGEPTP